MRLPPELTLSAHKAAKVAVRGVTHKPNAINAFSAWLDGHAVLGRIRGMVHQVNQLVLFSRMQVTPATSQPAFLSPQSSTSAVANSLPLLGVIFLWLQLEESQTDAVREWCCCRFLPRSCHADSGARYSGSFRCNPRRSRHGVGVRSGCCVGGNPLHLCRRGWCSAPPSAKCVERWVP